MEKHREEKSRERVCESGLDLVVNSVPQHKETEGSNVQSQRDTLTTTHMVCTCTTPHHVTNCLYSSDLHGPQWPAYSET